MPSMKLFKNKTIKTALAFDIGTRYIGVALYRNKQIFNLHTIEVDNPSKIKEHLVKTIQSYKPDIVFLGIPRRGKIRKLVFSLRKQLIEEYKNKILIKLVSEDRTSVFSRIIVTIKALRNRQNIKKMQKKAKTKGKIDAQSAVTILQLGLEKMRLRVE